MSPFLLNPFFCIVTPSLSIKSNKLFINKEKKFGIFLFLSPKGIGKGWGVRGYREDMSAKNVSCFERPPYQPELGGHVR